MLDTWNSSIFKDIKQRLQDCAMKLVYAERNGEAFDSQLVIGVRESYGSILFHLIINLRNSMLQSVLLILILKLQLIYIPIQKISY